jgi:hypothetical protein
MTILELWLEVLFSGSLKVKIFETGSPNSGLAFCSLMTLCRQDMIHFTEQWHVARDLPEFTMSEATFGTSDDRLFEKTDILSSLILELAAAELPVCA